jgi:hypothetical protein
MSESQDHRMASSAGAPDLQAKRTPLDGQDGASMPSAGPLGDRLARLRRSLDEMDTVVIELRAARVRQLAAVRRQRAEP